jgi:hypothetical protein
MLRLQAHVGAEKGQTAAGDGLQPSFQEGFAVNTPRKTVRFDTDSKDGNDKGKQEGKDRLDTVKKDGKVLTWTKSTEEFRLAVAEEQAGTMNERRALLHLVPVLEDRLYLALHNDVDLSHYFEEGVCTRMMTVHKSFVYRPFCADFGPLNLGMTFHFGQVLAKLLTQTPQNVRIIYPCADKTENPFNTTNAVSLLGAFLILHFHISVNEAWGPFSKLDPAPPPPPTPPNTWTIAYPTPTPTSAHSYVVAYRDATWTAAAKTFPLHLTACWSALKRAVEGGLFAPATFDMMKYLYYDKHGDLHECVKSRLFAFRGPVDSAQGGSTLGISSYFEVFRSLNITTIIRLNSPEYDRSLLTSMIGLF